MRNDTKCHINRVRVRGALNNAEKKTERQKDRKKESKKERKKVFVTIIANLAERTSWPNCQACSRRRAGNWRGHSRESIYSDKRRD
jgi:hypothetical protein